MGITVGYGDGLVAKRLFEDLVLPACSPRMLEGTLRLECLDDLQSAPLRHWDLAQTPWAKGTRPWFDLSDWIERRNVQGVDTSKALRFNDYGLAVQAAISDQGVLLAGWPALQDPMEAGLLVCPFPEQIQVTDVGFDVVTTTQAPAGQLAMSARIAP